MKSSGESEKRLENKRRQVRGTKCESNGARGVRDREGGVLLRDLVDLGKAAG